jgi:hypothetical protein
VHPDRSVQTTLAFHASRIVIDTGVLLAMASMSMTFVNSPAGNRSALAADALPAVLLLLPIFAVTLIPNHTRPLHPALGWGAMVLGLAALPYAFVKMLDAAVLADTLDGSVGFGPKLLVFGCVVTLLGIGVGLVRDLMGWPSGGTPMRPGAGRPKAARPDKTNRTEAAATQVMPATGPVTAARASAATDGEPTRFIAVTPPATQPVVEAPAPRPQTPVAPSVPPREPPVTAPTQSASRADIAPVQATAPTLGPPRRSPAPQEGAPTPRQTPPTDETAPTAPIQAVPSRPVPAPRVETEALFPGLEAIAGVSEQDEESEPDDPTMTTAERADAAMTDHLLSMFDTDEDTDLYDDEHGEDRSTEER